MKRAAGRAVLDAAAAIALLLDEPGSENLRQLEAGAILNSVNAAEVLGKLVSRGMPVREARAALDALHLEITPFDSALAAISAQFVRKGISLGNRCFLASCERHGHGWTSDRELTRASGKPHPAMSLFR